MAHTGVDQAQAAGAVVEQVAERLAHALAHQRQRGKMQHPVPRPVGQRRLHRGRVVQRRPQQPRRGRHRAGMPLAEVVEHHDLVAAPDQGQHHVAAHEPGAAGHKVSAHAGLVLPCRPDRGSRGRVETGCTACHAERRGPEEAGSRLRLKFRQRLAFGNLDLGEWSSRSPRRVWKERRKGSPTLLALPAPALSALRPAGSPDRRIPSSPARTAAGTG